MMIKDLKEFERLLKLCRKYGVSTITSDTLQLTLDRLPATDGGQEELPITDEELAFYAAGRLDD